MAKKEIATGNWQPATGNWGERCRRKWTSRHYVSVGVGLLVLLFIGAFIGEIRAPHFFLRSNQSGDDVHIKLDLELDESDTDTVEKMQLQKEESTSPFSVLSVGEQEQEVTDVYDDMNAWNKIWDIAGLLHAVKNEKKGNHTHGTQFVGPAKLNVTLISQDDGILSKLTARELFETFPSPAGADTVQIYNEKAYRELIQTFMTTKTNITICANGGSVTAGGGHINFDSRYYTKLTNSIRELNLNSAGGAVRNVGRGHGTRHSLHSAVFAPNFFPQYTDLLLWEFSINDYGYHIPEESIIEQERSLLIAWLSEVEKMRPQNNPPKVIMIYLWSVPFEFTDHQRVSNPVYDAHAQLAKEFDFVVGHVNVASYFDELRMKENDLKQLFLADAHHPSAAGHLSIAFLLLDLIRGKGSGGKAGSERRKGTDVDLPSQHLHRPMYKWFCGTESEAKKFVQSQVVEYGDGDDGIFSRWRSPLGTATLETPRNDVLPGTRQMFFDFASSEMQILGKQDPLRMDRQGSTSLSCCTAGASTSDYTTVKVPENADSIQNARSIYFGFGPGLSDVKDLKVYIDSDKEHVNGKLINVGDEEWKCFWSWKDVYDPMWFAFTEERTEISSIRICVENDRCDEEQELSEAMLISIAVY